MLVVGINPGHDGAIAAVKDRSVILALESEKDSFPRHEKLLAGKAFSLLECLGEVPDVIAIGGQLKEDWWFSGGNPVVEAGYYGADVARQRESTFCGERVTMFTSSHIRSHIMGAAGMAPRDDAKLRAVLVWEGYDGTFYLLDDGWAVVREIPVLRFPGARYAFLYAIADPRYSDIALTGHADESGKLMALAGFGDPAEADSRITALVDRLLVPDAYGRPKGDYSDVPCYNAGVEAEVTKTAAALLQNRMFEIFARVAQEEIPRDIPLYISGGCGLNCDWNTMWRELGHFSSVFVPPCPNDSGTALGTTLDALHAVTGDPRIDWNVYCGLDFEWDDEPNATNWERRPMEEAPLADALSSGRIVAWVQGRWELGPRALGNRSLLAEPFHSSTRDTLNAIKQREEYRPIAPVCRIEDADKVFDTDFHDPYMLYFRRVKSPDLGAVTHVDGSARVQTVTNESNKRLHDLLSVFADRHGLGVLCNTSLNYKRMGFINRMADLVDYCEKQGVSDMVVGDAWFQRVDVGVKWERPRLVTPKLIRKLIEQNVPEGATVIVISQGIDEMVELEGRLGWHFPQDEDGTFRGYHPADSEEAIAKLEELRDRGGSHLAVPETDLWWLEFYPGFREHLASRYRTILQDGGCVIFALEEASTDQLPGGR
jgi:hydroxymethyl cephem carbamoyltransferase